MLPRPSHELLLVTIIQCLVVKFRADFHAAPPKILSPTQTLTLYGMTYDASRKLPDSRSFGSAPRLPPCSGHQPML